ncbi:hypothetical protein C1N63_09900 [Pantoea ananatis]|nr:hypothetical protein C1N63_09900 [Pantoea ananatis]
MRCKADCVKNADEVGLFHLTPDISMRFSIWCFINKKKVKKKKGHQTFSIVMLLRLVLMMTAIRHPRLKKGALCLLAFFQDQEKPPLCNSGLSVAVTAFVNLPSVHNKQRRPFSGGGPMGFGIVGNLITHARR